MGDDNPETPVTSPGIPSGVATVIERRGAGDPTATPEVSAFDPPAERFEGRGELGRGGMGFVVDAFDHALGRQVAIKQMLSTDPLDLRRFEREARITARLEHPSIVPLHDAGRSADGSPFYVMRKVDGRPLDQLVDKHSLGERIALVPNVLASCDAVAYAHARGIIHRDIKPTNILVGPFGETLLIDWGLAREVGDGSDDDALPRSDVGNLTRVGTVAGTPGFMAPEQARGEAVDRRADVFSLGATLFYVLAGRAPYGSHSATEMIQQVGTDRPPDWKLIPAEVPPDLRAIVVKAMASDPAGRYASGGELAADLRRFTTGQLVGAYRYDRRARLARFIKRNRAALSVGAISLGVLAIVATVSIRRIVSERDAATEAHAVAEQGRRDAVDSADKLLVRHALELAAVDPSAAIAQLRQLAPSSRRWPEAAVAAQAASVQGIPFGFNNTTGAGVVLKLAISPDSRHAFTVTRDGDLVVFDLIERSRRELAHLPALYGAAWYDATRIAYGTVDSLLLVDATTGDVVRKIDLGGRLNGLYGEQPADRMLLVGRAVYELTGEARELGAPILTDVDELDATPTLDRAVVRRGHALFAWSRTAMVPLGAAGKWNESSISGDDIGVLIDGVVHVWHLDGDVPTETLKVAAPHLLMLKLWRGEPYGWDSNGLVRFGSQGPVTVGSNDVMIPTEGPGLLVPAADGSIRFHTEDGWLRLGKREATYQRLALSPDRRFLVATTHAGTVLVWDLPTFQPRRLEVAAEGNPFLLTEHALWSSAFGMGVFRQDLATGAVDKLFDALMPDVLVSADRRWMVAIDRKPRQATIYDTVTDKLGRFDEAALAASDLDGVIAVSHAGRVVRWSAATPNGAIVTELGFDPQMTLAGGRYFVGVDTGGRIIRIGLDGGRAETRIEGTARHGTLDPATGTLWIIVDGKLWRWDGEQPPRELVDVPGPCTRVWWTGAGIVAETAGVLYRIDVAPPRLIASNVNVYSVDRELIATLSPRLDLTIHDLPTGLGFGLPSRPDSLTELFVNARVVAFKVNSDVRHHSLYEVWNLSVPRAPDELRSWLSRVSNAVTVPDSIAVSWPAR